LASHRSTNHASVGSLRERQVSVEPARSAAHDDETILEIADRIIDQQERSR